MNGFSPIDRIPVPRETLEIPADALCDGSFNYRDESQKGKKVRRVRMAYIEILTE
jgi:hypothetical protein